MDFELVEMFIASDLVESPTHLAEHPSTLYVCQSALKQNTLQFTGVSDTFVRVSVEL